MCIQIQPERCHELDTDQAVVDFQSLDGIHDVTVNATPETTDGNYS